MKLVRLFIQIRTIIRKFLFKNGSNLTIRGEGDVKLKNFGFSFDNYHNVIIENLVIHEVFYPNDPITINNSHYFYIHITEISCKPRINRTKIKNFNIRKKR